MAEKLPFTFTPNIVRYLKEVIDVYEMHIQGVPKEYAFTPFLHLTDAYIFGETFYSFSEANRHSFVEYVGRDGAVEIKDADEGDKQLPYEDKVDYQTLDLDDPEINKGFGHHPWQIFIHVSDIRPMLMLWKTYLAQKGTPITLEDVQIERLSYKNRRLTYFDNIHTFQKGKNSDSVRLKIFEKLWQERQHTVNGQRTETGNSMTLEALGNRIGTKPMMSEIYGLEAVLKGKGMPIQIEKVRDSVHLIVDEVF